jgi:hypothetical protein
MFLQEYVPRSSKLLPFMTVSGKELLNMEVQDRVE